MALRYCYQLITPTKGPFKLEKPPTVCKYIPALIVDFPRKFPLFSRIADAIRLVFSPRSASWVPGALADSGLDEQTARDLRILATVDALAEKLSPALRDSLTSSVLSAAKRLELPAESVITVAAA